MTCQKIEIMKGGAYPRSCPECGLNGKCKYIGTNDDITYTVTIYENVQPMKTLKQLLQDANRYQAIRESGEISAGLFGFAMRTGGMSEADKLKLDLYADQLYKQQTKET